MQYLYRLRDECVLLYQFDEAIAFLTKLKESEKVARVSLMKLDHIYYKTDNVYARTKEALKGQPDKLKEVYLIDGPSDKLVSSMVD